MPQHQSSDDDPVEDGELPPSGGQKFACAPAVAVVEAVQREEGHDSRECPENHGESLDHRRARREARVRLDRDVQTGCRRIEVAEDATTCGRLSPSMTRGSEPVALKVVRVGSAASVSAHPVCRSATGVESNT